MSFGIYYLEYLEYFQGSTAQTLSWIIAVAIFCAGIFALVNGEIVHRFGYVTGGMLGSLLAAAGFFLCVFATKTVYLLIGYGVLTGIGTNLLFITYNVAIQSNFTKYRSLATGCAGLGFSIGTFVNPMLVRYLCDTYAWRGSMLIQTGIYLQGILFSSLLKLVSKCKTEKVVLSKAQKTKRYKCRGIWTFVKSYLHFLKNIKILAIIVVVCCGTMNMVFYNSFTVARYIAFGEHKMKAALLITLTGVGNIPGRLVLGYIGDNCNRLVLYAILNFGFGISTFLGSCFTNYYLQAAFSISIGFEIGGAVAVFGSVIVDVAGLKNFPKVFGVIIVFTSIAGLLPTPIAGWYINRTGNYSHVTLLSGGLLSIASGSLLIIVIMHLLQEKRSKNIHNRQDVEVPLAVPDDKKQTT